jgi:hypothetical protein
MKKALVVALLVLAPFAARAQQASEQERQMVESIARCLLPGLPPTWVTVYLVLELDAPGGDNGEVSYVFMRAAGNKLETFKPCDPKAPAAALLEARKDQAPERRNWKFARLTLHRGGKFEVNYEY